MDKIIIYIISFTIIFILLLLWSKIKLNRQLIRESKAKIKLEEYKINMNLNIEENIVEQFNTLIANTFTEYITLNIEFRELEIITTDIENTISKDVAKNVVEKMSPVFIVKLKSN